MASHTSATAMPKAIALIKISMPSVNYKFANFHIKLIDVYHGGTGTITGTVKDKGTPDAPVIRRVRLHRKVDGMLVRETWSAADGSYSFPYMAAQLYYVVSHDHTGNFNAVIKDSITPVMS